MADYISDAVEDDLPLVRRERRMKSISALKIGCIIPIFFLATTIGSQAQIFNNLFQFDGTNGSDPGMSLIQGIDGNFYGTTQEGGNFLTECGNNGCGTVFKISPSGTLTTIYNFCAQKSSEGFCLDGVDPVASLVQANDGNFYGTTAAGGSSNFGTVFRITPAGALTTMHNLGGADGFAPYASMVQGTDGNLYGTASAGGNFNGTIFKITPSGIWTVLHTFNGADGSTPDGRLTQARSGAFYGTTSGGGTNCLPNGCGTIFKMTLGGALTTLHNFDGNDGANPWAGLVQGPDGSLYGTTGGVNGGSTSTVFKITLGGTLTTLSTLCSQPNCAYGYAPDDGLIFASDGNLYGTTEFGGNDACDEDCGTIFNITPSGALTTLYNFDGTEGRYPRAGLLQATNGSFYGTTGFYYSAEPGTVFNLSMLLAPFVETRPDSGRVGASVIILGDNLAGTTGVTFNGTAATLSLVSNSAIKVAVPVGATSGIVAVTTPSGTLKTIATFRVTP
jgi:uncharacterized repeat protein (TIGR03803 family)